MAIDDVRLAPPVRPWVDLGDPDRFTGRVRGSVRIVDESDRAVRFGPELSTTAKGGLVAVDPHSGRFSYTPSASARHVSATGTDYRDKVDTFTVDVVDAYGTAAAAHIVVDILAANVPNGGWAMVGRPSASGVLTGRIEAAACDGARPTFSLANTSNPADSTVESAYSVKGGLVQLDSSTGQFVFVPSMSGAAGPGLDTDSFVVTVTHALGSSADVVVEPPAQLRITVDTTDVAPGVQRGRLAVGDDVPLSFSLGTPAGKGTAQVDRDGNYVYTRTPGLGHGITAADSFTIIGTDDYGRSVTVATVAVAPPLAPTPPARAAVAVFESSVNGLGNQTTRGIAAVAGAGMTFRAGTVTSTKGSSVKIAADGTFTYSGAQNLGVGHAAAAVDALAADKVDTVTVTAEDSDGVCIPVLVTVKLHPYNNTPTQSTVGGSARVCGAKTGEWTTSVVDVDGDDITYSVIQHDPRGMVSVRRDRAGAFTVHYRSTSVRAGAWYPGETFTIRYYDGHLKSDGTPAYVAAEYTF